MKLTRASHSESRRIFLKQAALTAGAMAVTPNFGLSRLGLPDLSARYRNVLLIVLDDMNDWTSLLSDTRVQTPNLERLARRSMVFTRAYCPAPACCPSRTSFLTGLRPSTSGVYFNNQSYRDAGGWLREVVNLPQHFKANGFLTAGYGKIFHGGYQDRDAHSWSDGHYVGQESEADLYAAAEELTDLEGVWPYSWGMLPDEWDRDDWNRMQQDTRNAIRVSRLIEGAQETRFFAALGIFRPHSRWFVPRRYFDLYNESKLRIPAGYRADDLNDLPPLARWLAKDNVTPETHRKLLEKGLWLQAIQAYAASITYADEQLGRVLDALEDSPHNDDTIVMLCSDHGYHLGEKEHWNKFTLWERSTRVPFMISLPGLMNTEPIECPTPVSLIDIYPTLLHLCDLPSPDSHELEGEDLSPILANRGRGSRAPVLSTYGRGNHSIRSKRWRYIRYVDGSEELYDHLSDRHEWNNLASDAGHRETIARLRHFLPKEEATGIPTDPNRQVEWLDSSLFVEGAKRP